MKIIFLNEMAHLFTGYQTSHSAGLDLVACLEQSAQLGPNESMLIPSGISIRIPKNCEAQVRSRSGCALRGLIVLNSPGTIDSDYTGEIKIILKNVSQEAILIYPGDRIAQLVVSKIKRFKCSTKTKKRNNLGFGSTGINDLNE